MDRPTARITPSQRFTIERQLQQLSPFAAHHSPGRLAPGRSSPQMPSLRPPEVSSPHFKALGESHAGASSAPARTHVQPRRSQEPATPHVKGHGNTPAAMAAAAAVAAALSPHRPSSTHSSPCLSTRGEPPSCNSRLVLCIACKRGMTLPAHAWLALCKAHTLHITVLFSERKP